MYQKLYSFIEAFKECVKISHEEELSLVMVHSSGDYLSSVKEASYREIISKVEIERARIKEERTSEKSFEELVLEYIKDLDNERYFKKNGNVKTTLFHEDAFVGNDSWATLVNNEPCEKETVLRIVMALKLDCVKAHRLLKSTGHFFSENDERDIVLMALMACGEYRPMVIYHVLEHEKEKNKKIRNIYTKKHYELMCE